MARNGQVFVYDPVQKKVVERSQVIGEENVAPYVQDDTIPDTESYATDEGKKFNSKSALMRHYKEHGYECTGGDHLTGTPVQGRQYKASREEIVAEVLEAKRKIEWGMAPSTEKERERWRQENERLKR